MSEKLYYKRYDEYPVEIPGDSIILRQRDVDSLQANYPAYYPTPFCLEVDGINRINANEEGWFDFSKSIIDIGADLGEYSWLCNFSRAYAFEPNRSSVYAMVANLLLRGKFHSTQIYEYFLSDSEKEVSFNGFNTLDEFNIIDGDNLETIRTKTLDSFKFRDVGMIKMDVELHEYEVLCGSRETIEANGFPPIVFECFDVGVFGMTQERYDNTIGFLTDYGYTIHDKWIDRNTHLAVKE